MFSYKRLLVRGRRLRARWSAFSKTKRGKRLTKAFRYVFTAGIVVYLAARLSHIGWGALWEALPRTPWFYVLFAGMYLTLPVFQALIFGVLWKLPPPQLFSPMLKKRVYDKDVLSYSGDVFIYFWAQRRTGLPGRAILHSIKDNTIVSAAVSTLIAVGLLALFFFSGLMKVPDFIEGHQVAYAVGGGLVLSVVGALAVRFRTFVFKVPGRLLLALGGLHGARILVVQGLQIVQWSVVLPDVPLPVWFTYLAAQIIVGRIPLLPSRDLIFVGVGIGLAATLQVPEAAIAGLLGVQSVLDKCANALLFVAVSFFNRTPTVEPDAASRPGRRREAEQEALLPNAHAETADAKP